MADLNQFSRCKSEEKLFSYIWNKTAIKTKVGHMWALMVERPLIRLILYRSVFFIIVFHNK